MLDEVSEEIFSLYYRPSDSDMIAKGKGKDSSSVLGHELAQLMKDRMDGSRDIRFVELSCHDLNVMAFAARLGVDIPHPWFTGYWLFELHCPIGGTENEAFVRAFFNVNPTQQEVPGQHRRIPFGKQVFSKWDELPVGDIPFAEFTEALIEAPLLQLTGLLRKVHLRLQGRDSGLPGCETPSLCSEEVATRYPQEAQDRWQQAFALADLNHDGVISRGELVACFRRLDLAVCSTELEKLLELFGWEADREIKMAEFAIIMHTLEEAVRPCDGLEDE